jgi:hypothetical protein
LLLLPGHLSQHAKAATAEGLTFSDPMHKKVRENSNLYYFCHSAKKLTAVSPFSAQVIIICTDPGRPAPASEVAGSEDITYIPF